MYYNSNKAEQVLKEIENNLGIQLDVTLDSKKEGVDADEIEGDYLQCEVYPNPVEDLEVGPPIILIYPETKKMQFFHEATPYPTLIKQDKYKRNMGMFLNPIPVSIEEVTEDDYNSFIDAIIEEYQ